MSAPGQLTRVRAGRRRRRWPWVLLVVVALLAAPGYSYATTMMKPSSLPLGVRSVEWLRTHHMRWLVNDVEHYYYKWTAPKKGGPPIRTLPSLPATNAPVAVHRQRAAAAYRPPRIRPLIRPVIPGEGIWQPAGLLVHGQPAIRTAEYRPSRDYPRIVAYLAWVDHRQTQLALYPGRYQPPSHQPRGPMMVPSGQRWRLLATFNSGFTWDDGRGGFALDGRSYTPLSKGMGTLVGYRDGRVDIVSWRGGTGPGPIVAFARQNLPLIVDHGRPNPNLSDSQQWGYTLGNAVMVWRSAVGIDRHGNLIYAAADHQTVRTLAAILVRAGAVRAIELDINAEWPTFNVYAHYGGNDPSKLVPNSMQAATRYLSPDDRDFFVIYRRVPGGSGLVPFG